MESMMCMARREDRGSVNIIYSHLGNTERECFATRSKKKDIGRAWSGRQ